jgi:hypothetical protein
MLNLESTNYYIDRLNENSYGVISSGTYASKTLRVDFDDDARQIIKINDKNKLRKLFDQIKRPKKTLVINYILLEILYKRDNI